MGGSIYDNRTVLVDLEVDSETLSIDEINNRVGIGLTDPDSTLEVFSATTQQKWSYDADSFATITVANASHTIIATGESGDLTLDAGDDIILDSHVGKWRLMRNGTLTNLISATAVDGSKLVFDNQVSNAGYEFKCNDGGSGITALSIDAANAGAATFNSTVTATGFTIGSAAITEAELEVLDGATLSTTELNYVDGVTSAIQTQLDGKSPVAGHSSIATVGTISSGTWQGTAIASAYLDSDTAHLSGAQTFTGTKTLNSFKGTGSVTVTNILDEDAMGSDSATALATQQSIKAYADTKSPVAGGGSIVTTGALNSGSITSGFGSIDVGSSVIATTGSVTAGTVDINNGIADNNISGIVASFTAGEDMNRGDVCFFQASDSKMWKANHATGQHKKLIVAMAAEDIDISAAAVGRFLMQGFCRDATTFPTFTIGAAIYGPEAEGPPTSTAPSDDGDLVQVLGWAVTGDMVFFNPSMDVIEVA